VNFGTIISVDPSVVVVVFDVRVVVDASVVVVVVVEVLVVGGS